MARKNPPTAPEGDSDAVPMAERPSDLTMSVSVPPPAPEEPSEPVAHVDTIPLHELFPPTSTAARMAAVDPMAQPATPAPAEEPALVPATDLCACGRVIGFEHGEVPFIHAGVASCIRCFAKTPEGAAMGIEAVKCSRCGLVCMGGAGRCSRCNHTNMLPAR